MWPTSVYEHGQVDERYVIDMCTVSTYVYFFHSLATGSDLHHGFILPGRIVHKSNSNTSKSSKNIVTRRVMLHVN